MDFSLAEAANDPKNHDILMKAFRHFRLRQGYEGLFLSIVNLRLDTNPQFIHNDQTHLAKEYLVRARFHERYYHGILAGIVLRYGMKTG